MQLSGNERPPLYCITLVLHIRPPMDSAFNQTVLGSDSPGSKSGIRLTNRILAPRPDIREGLALLEARIQSRYGIIEDGLRL